MYKGKHWKRTQNKLKACFDVSNPVYRTYALRILSIDCERKVEKGQVLFRLGVECWMEISTAPFQERVMRNYSYFHDWNHVYMFSDVSEHWQVTEHWNDNVNSTALKLIKAVVFTHTGTKMVFRLKPLIEISWWKGGPFLCSPYF